MHPNPILFSISSGLARSGDLSQQGFIRPGELLSLFVGTLLLAPLYKPLSKIGKEVKVLVTQSCPTQRSFKTVARQAPLSLEYSISFSVG